MAVVSFWIITTASVLERPVLERLSRAPPGPLGRDRVTPVPHGGTRYYRRKNGTGYNAELRKRGAWKGAIPGPRYGRGS